MSPTENLELIAELARTLEASRRVMRDHLDASDRMIETVAQVREKAAALGAVPLHLATAPAAVQVAPRDPRTQRHRDHQK